MFVVEPVLPLAPYDGASGPPQGLVGEDIAIYRESSKRPCFLTVRIPHEDRTGIQLTGSTSSYPICSHKSLGASHAQSFVEIMYLLSGVSSCIFQHRIVMYLLGKIIGNVNRFR